MAAIKIRPAHAERVRKIYDKHGLRKKFLKYRVHEVCAFPMSGGPLGPTRYQMTCDLMQEPHNPFDTPARLITVCVGPECETLADAEATIGKVRAAVAAAFPDVFTPA